MYVYVYCLGISNSLLIRPTLCVETLAYTITILFCLNYWNDAITLLLSAVYVVYHQWAWCCYSNSRASVRKLKTGSRLVGNSFWSVPTARPDSTQLNCQLSWVGSGSGDRALRYWVDTCFSTACMMSQTRDQQLFVISEVAADCHKIMILQRTMRPSIAHMHVNVGP